MKTLAPLLLLLGCAACQSGNELTGPTSSAVPIAGRVIEFLSRETKGLASIEFRTAAGTPVLATATDGAGRYSATLPHGGEYLIYISGVPHGSAYVGGPGYIGELIFHDGRCVARYGTVTDEAGRPLANATVALGPLNALSAADGWYAIEFGCPSNGIIGGNTIMMSVSREGYAPASRIVGRGIAGVQRLDVALFKRD